MVMPFVINLLTRSGSFVKSLTTERGQLLFLILIMFVIGNFRSFRCFFKSSTSRFVGTPRMTHVKVVLVCGLLGVSLLASESVIETCGDLYRVPAPLASTARACTRFEEMTLIG